MKRLFGIVLLLVCLFIPQAVYAQEDGLDISVRCPYEEEMLSGVTVTAWRVADSDKNYTEDFSGCGISLSMDAASVEKLYEYASGNAAGMSAQTGRSPARFDVTQGYYLVCAQDFETDSVKLEFRPCLLEVTDKSYDVELKHTTIALEKPEPVAIKVIIVWSGGEEESVTVGLLKDNAEADSVKITGTDNWQYIWDNLKLDAFYSVTGQAFDGYKQTVKQEGNTFIITYTKIQTPEPVGPTPTPSPEVTPTPGKPGTPGPSVKPSAKPGATPGAKPSDEPVVTHFAVTEAAPAPVIVVQTITEKMPQTGQNWVIVAALFLMGAALMVCALIFGGFRKLPWMAPRLAAFVMGVYLLSLSASFFVKNIMEDSSAKISAERLAEELNELETEPESDEIPLFIGAEDEVSEVSEEIPEMPVAYIEGTAYIGTLSLPDLGLELPIAAETDMAQLRLSPCRYEGSVYDDTLVVAAHNYKSHFGRIKSLEPGSEMTFTDVDGNVYQYKSAGIEVLEPDDLEGLRERNPGITLITCTLGGKQRVAVRFEPIGIE